MRLIKFFVTFFLVFSISLAYADCPDAKYDCTDKNGRVVGSVGPMNTYWHGGFSGYCQAHCDDVTNACQQYSSKCGGRCYANGPTSFDPIMMTCGDDAKRLLQKK